MPNNAPMQTIAGKIRTELNTGSRPPERIVKMAAPKAKPKKKRKTIGGKNE